MNDIQFTAIPLQNPLYKEVKRQIMLELINGEWKPGNAIPAEKKLSERFKVSIGTIRKAIDELVAENILIRQQGRGTFVASHNRDRLLFYFFHIVGHDGTKQYPVVALDSFAKRRAEADEAEQLGLARGDPIFRIRNILKLDDVPVIVDEITIDQKRFPELTERQFAGRPNTIYNLYQEAFGISVVRTQERLRAILADARNARLLGVAARSPLLRIARIAFTYQDTPIEFRISTVNTERHEYWSEIRNMDR
ncbi:MAG: GntR family transcriptional regulator [Betaproteobacteria bacterium]